MINLLGFIGTILINIGYMPQIIKTFRTKDVTGLSSNTYIILIIASIAWIGNGIGSKNWPVIVCNSICLLQQVSLLYLTYKQRRKCIK